jgi:hypothetical protein
MLALNVVVWLAAEDARQAALLDAREQEVTDRLMQALSRQDRLDQDGEPTEEVRRANGEVQQASRELTSLWAEQAWRREPWHARLIREVRRRTGL